MPSVFDEHDDEVAPPPPPHQDSVLSAKNEMVFRQRVFAALA